jgi:hypothetical protein
MGLYSTPMFAHQTVPQEFTPDMSYLGTRTYEQYKRDCRANNDNAPMRKQQRLIWSSNRIVY